MKKMWNYKYHRNANRCYYYDKLTNLSSIPERVTFLTFNQWKAFYNADPENWRIYEKTEDDKEVHKYKIAIYDTNPKNAHNYKDSYIYIKFLTPYDYTQFLQYVEELEKNGEDYENSQEILALSKIIQQRSEERLKKIQKELADAAEHNRQMYEKAKVAQLSNGTTLYKIENF